MTAIEERIIGVYFEVAILRQDTNEEALGKAVSEEADPQLDRDVVGEKTHLVGAREALEELQEQVVSVRVGVIAEVLAHEPDAARALQEGECGACLLDRLGALLRLPGGIDLTLFVSSPTTLVGTTTGLLLARIVFCSRSKSRFNPPARRGFVSMKTFVSMNSLRWGWRNSTGSSKTAGELTGLP